MNKRLVKRVAKEMYKNRMVYKYVGDKHSDYMDALRFLRMWGEEYKYGDVELIRVWCRNIKAGGIKEKKEEKDFWLYVIERLFG